MILGHLVPAGTGFRTYQQSEVRIRPQALEGLAVEKEDVLARHFPLLETAGKDGGRAAGRRPEPAPVHRPPALDELFGRRRRRRRCMLATMSWTLSTAEDLESATSARRRRTNRSKKRHGRTASQFPERDGKKAFVVLPYEEFLLLEEEAESFADLKCFAPRKPRKPTPRRSLFPRQNEELGSCPH